MAHLSSSPTPTHALRLILSKASCSQKNFHAAGYSRLGELEAANLSTYPRKHENLNALSLSNPHSVLSMRGRRSQAIG
jgi:predicted DNA-binding protein with PD1-like motif